MPRKLAIKIAVDMVMTVLLLLLMAFSLIGETTHEWLGTMMCILLISHHILNAGWYKNMRKSRYSTFRVFQTALVGLLFLMMLGSMISGILLSRYVFNFLQVRVGWELMGSVHLFCAYWNFLLTGLHLGFHWSMVLGIIRKITGTSAPPICVAVLWVLAMLIAVYGAVSFFKNDILLYLLLRTHFVNFNYERPLFLFFTDHLAILGLLAVLMHYAGKLLKRGRSSNIRKEKFL